MTCTECLNMDYLSRNEWLQSQVFIYVLLFVTALSKGCSAFTLRVKLSVLDGGNEGTMVLCKRGNVYPVTQHNNPDDLNLQ